MRNFCKEENCERVVHGHGLCIMHFKRVWRKSKYMKKEKVSRKNICSIEGCGEYCAGRGFCRTHYMQKRLSGEFMKMDGNVIICKIEGCDQLGVKKGMCQKHYERIRRYNDPNAGEFKYRHKTKEGYIKVNISGKKIAEHRLVMEGVIGRKLYKHEDVHHINGVRDDNRPENLELWSHSHARGQKVEDKIKWCVEFLKGYGVVDFTQTEIITGTPINFSMVESVKSSVPFVLTEML